MNIFLIRHGKTLAPEQYNGVTDIALSDKGREQAQDAAMLLEGVVFDAWYCSPLQRCRETLRLLDQSAEATLCEALREIDFGEWEGLTREQIAERDPKGYEQWQKERACFCFPGGESAERFSQRIARWIDGLVAEHHENVLIVAHAGVIRRALCRLLGITPKQAYRMEILEAGVTLISHHPTSGCVLHYLNRCRDGICLRDC